MKDLVRIKTQWGTVSEGAQVNNTINILKVELAKESPESWKRIKSQLQEQVEGMEQ